MIDNIIEKMSDILNKRDRIFVFGTGRNAEKLFVFLENKERKDFVYAFVDNNPEKWGKEFFGKLIISADDLKKEVTPMDAIILSMNESMEVEIQLQTLGINQNLIFSISLFADELSEKEIVNTKNRIKHDKSIIRIGFLSQEIESWDKTAPVYELMKKHHRFFPCIFVVPKVDFDTLELKKESDLDAFKNLYPDDHIFLVNEKTKMEDFRLDYLFLTSPYDDYYPLNLKSSYLVKQTLLCYIPYGYNGAYNFVSNNTNRTFFRNIYITFVDTIEVKERLLQFFEKSVERKNRKILDIGYPSLERRKSTYGDNQKNGAIMWTPRWSYDNKVGGSHFFEYYNFICTIKMIYPQRKIVFRPHPMMFDNFLRKGLLNKEDIEHYKKEIASLGIILDENSELNTAFEEVSVLITDFSTLIMQFFMTGRPIIYCASEKIKLNSDYTELMEGIYIAKNEHEIRNALYKIFEMNDPLREKRKLIKEKFDYKFQGSTKRVLHILENDFLTI